MQKHRLFNILMIVVLCLSTFGSLSISKPVAASQTQAETPNSEFIVVRVYFSDRADLDSLASQLDIWEVNHTDGYLVAMVTTGRFDLLSQQGYRVEIDQAKTDQIHQPLVPIIGQTDGIPNFPCYRTVEENYASMDEIAATYPGLVDKTDIGDSWDKATDGGPAGYDMWMMRLTNESRTEKYGRFFLMASTHARELVTTETAMRLMEHLLSNYGIDPDITWMLDYYELYFVPSANPDGRKFAETGEWWRKNTDNDDGCTSYPDYGTDLNRNNDFHWGGAGTNPCDDLYQGPSANSEPENQAIEAQVLSLFPDQRGPLDTDPAPADTTGLFITLHSYSDLVLWPWGWTYTDGPNHAQLRTLGRKFAYFNNYTPQQSSDLYTTTGTHDDWAYGVLGIAGYTFEMGEEFFQSCDSFENIIYPDNRDALLNGIKASRAPYMTPSGPESVDLTVTPIAIAPGDPVHLTATANDTRYSNNNGSEPTQNISEARYSIDDPSFVTGTVTSPMTASDGSFNSTIEGIEATIDTTGWANGRHTIFVESKDAAGNWGYTSAVFIDVIDPDIAPHITGHVYDTTSGAPIEATITAGGFQTTSDPVTGLYEMVVLSGTYDITASANNYLDQTVTGVVAEDYQTVEQDFYLTPMCDVFFDDVEGGNLGWTVQSPWAITSESSHSPSNSWTDSPGGNYGNSKNVSITSPTFDMTDWGNVNLRFWHIYETQANYDNAIVEYSVDDGVNWIEAVRYSGDMTTWSEVRMDLPALNGIATAKIRFRLNTNNYVVDNGWHIDDIGLSGTGDACGAPQAPTAEFSSNSPVYLGSPVEFTNQSTGTPPLTYAWDFGDGVGASTEKNPTYTYASIGTYTVTLTTTNDYGSSLVSHPVEVLEPICVDLSSVDVTLLTSAPIYPGDVVEFSVDVTPDEASKPYTYTVDYGDGNVFEGTSSDDPLTLSHTFDTPGDFTVALGALNCAMSESVTDEVNLTVSASPVPITSVELSLVTTSTIYAGDMVDFSADILPDDADKPYTFTVDFGDSSPVFSDTTALDPLPFTHTYLASGSYTVQIEAWNAYNTEPITDSFLVVVNEPGTVFSTFLPLVAKTGTPAGLTNQMQKGFAVQANTFSFLPLPAFLSAMLGLPIIKKLR